MQRNILKKKKKNLSDKHIISIFEVFLVLLQNHAIWVFTIIN